MKTCSVCKIEKDYSEFSKHTYGKDGIRSSCKKCVKEYRNDNKDAISKQKKEYYISVSEKMKEQYIANRDTILKQKREYYHANPEMLRERTRRWYRENPEKGREISRRKNAKKAEVEENYTKEDEAYTRELFGDRCFRCGDIEKLQIDHHYPLSSGNALTRENAVLLCKSCNCSKGPKQPEEFYDEAMLDELEHILEGEDDE